MSAHHGTRAYSRQTDQILFLALGLAVAAMGFFLAAAFGTF